MTVPTLLYVAGLADLVRLIAGSWVASTVAVASLEVTVVVLKVVVAVAWLVTEPPSRSAWVIVYEAVQVVVALGAKGPVPQAKAVPSGLPTWSSLTENGPARVTLPVFLIVYV